MRYLLDTNALIELMRNGGSAIARRIRHHPISEVAIPAIAMHELYFGAYKSSRMEENLVTLDKLIFELVPVEREDARMAGEIRALLLRSGTSIGHYDILIAGQALARGLVLVTHNVREFGRVPGLRVEDWQGE
jgi:tRNA(fMet)-specific endonuclease VapC